MSDWTDEKNARRCKLVDARIDGVLSGDELMELDALQDEMLTHRRQVAPLPIDEARKAHDQPKPVLANGAIERIIAAIDTAAILAEARKIGARGCERNEVEERIVQIVTAHLRVALGEDRAAAVAERLKADERREATRRAEKRKRAKLFRERKAK